MLVFFNNYMLNLKVLYDILYLAIGVMWWCESAHLWLVWVLRERYLVCLSRFVQLFCILDHPNYTNDSISLFCLSRSSTVYKGIWCQCASDMCGVVCPTLNRLRYSRCWLVSLFFGIFCLVLVDSHICFFLNSMSCSSA